MQVLTREKCPYYECARLLLDINIVKGIVE
jgi:hypothetical protein